MNAKPNTTTDLRKLKLACQIVFNYILKEFNAPKTIHGILDLKLLLVKILILILIELFLAFLVFLINA